MEEGMMLDTVRAQCFRPKPGEQITDFQVAAFISIAVEMKVNPLLPGMLFAFPTKGGGIVPVIGPDGVFKKLAEREDVDGWKVTVYPEDIKLPPTHATAWIYRKGSEHPLEYTAVLSEWAIRENPNWVTRPRHMLGLRALKHAARQIIHGIPGDSDDAIITEMNEINVTPTAPGSPPAPGAEPEKRPDPNTVKHRGPGRPAKGTQAEPKPAAPAAPAGAPGGPALDINPTPAAPASPAPAPAPAAKTEGGAPANTDKGPIVPLADKKSYTLKGAKIISAAFEQFGPKNGCKAVVESADFSGTLYDLTGAHQVAGGEGVKNEVLPIWKTKNPVTIEMHGSFSKMRGYCIAIVDKVAAEAEAPEVP
jgi:hypothetical protein